jgi:hypothetical protein
LFLERDASMQKRLSGQCLLTARYIPFWVFFPGAEGGELVYCLSHTRVEICCASLYAFFVVGGWEMTKFFFFFCTFFVGSSRRGFGGVVELKGFVLCPCSDG